jgi:hypothetical protein
LCVAQQNPTLHRIAGELAVVRSQLQELQGCVGARQAGMLADDCIMTGHLARVQQEIQRKMQELISKSMSVLASPASHGSPNHEAAH